MVYEISVAMAGPTTPKFFCQYIIQRECYSKKDHTGKKFKTP